MRKAAIQIAACAGILIIFCLVCRLTVFRTYHAYIPLPPSVEERIQAGHEHQVKVEEAGTIHLGPPEFHPGYVRVQVHPDAPGEVWIDVTDENGEAVTINHLRVGPFHTVYNLQNGGFTGDTAVMIAVTLFWFLVTAIMIWHYTQARGSAYYAYSTIYYAGFSLFSLITGLAMLNVTVMHLKNPVNYSMLSVYSTINGASMRFVLLTMPLILIFALMLAVSNVELLRHERPCRQNVLGFAVSFLLLLGSLICVLLYVQDSSGSEMEGRIRNTLVNVYATVFAYGECMLAGSVICGIRAGRYRPAMGKDFIIILGCWFRKDGTLPPLLRGRADQAITFWKQQKETTGKEALLIPSGGQGRDECMPEAEAIRQYLLSQGIPDRLIHPECESRNTLENMKFSKQIADAVNPKGKVVFATTNYHVFRSGVWAARAGLRAEGMGGKTRWWYWPNAFMRECAGLLLRRWKQELLLMILLMVFFGLLSMVLF